MGRRATRAGPPASRAAAAAGPRSKTLGGGRSEAGRPRGSRGLVAWRLRGVRAREVAREEEKRPGGAALGTAAPQGPQRPAPVRRV